MKAFVAQEYASPAVVRAVDLPEPDVGPTDVLIQVEAAGVNPLDSKIAAGEFKLVLPYRPPIVLGHDVAGTVTRVGASVTRFSPGDAVFSRPRDFRIGTFAERVAVPEGDVALKPESTSFPEAAALPLVALTAWQALVDRARVSPGQKVLVHAGSGGVGTIAIQLAKHLGAHVAATTSRANAELVQSLGADVVVDYRAQAFEDVLSDYDVVIDPLGPDHVLTSLTVLKPGGIVIGLGGPPDPAFAASIGANPLVKVGTRLLSTKVRRAARKQGVRYSFLFMTADGKRLGEIARLVDAGVIRPVVDRVLPFDDTLAALAHVDTGRAQGKVVVSMT